MNSKEATHRERIETRHDKGGFSLVEMLVVMAIIAILASISIYGLNIARMRGRDAQRKTDLDKVRAGLTVFFADNKSYPLPVNTPNPDTVNHPLPPGSIWNGAQAGYNDAGANAGMMSRLLAAGYLEGKVADPRGDTAYKYRYRVSTDGLQFELSAKLENTKDTAVIDDISSAQTINSADSYCSESTPGDDLRYEVGTLRMLDTGDNTASKKYRFYNCATRAETVGTPWVYAFDSVYTCPLCKTE